MPAGTPRLTWGCDKLQKLLASLIGRVVGYFVFWRQLRELWLPALLAVEHILGHVRLSRISTFGEIQNPLCGDLLFGEAHSGFARVDSGPTFTPELVWLFIIHSQKVRLLPKYLMNFNESNNGM